MEIAPVSAPPVARRDFATKCPRIARAQRRSGPAPGGVASAISAIIFLMIAWPKELKSFASTTKAPDPPITLSR